MVRDALLHLYDVTYLQTHALGRGLKVTAGDDASFRGKRLLQVLLDAIESLRPVIGAPADSRAWRSYHLLELRYIRGLTVDEAIARLAISKTQYWRDHARALEAVASPQLAETRVFRGRRGMVVEVSSQSPGATI